MATAITLAGCSKSTDPISEQPEKTQSNTVVLTDQQLQNAALTSGAFDTIALARVIEMNGVIDVPPQNIVSISIPSGGYLESTHLLPGTKVQKGEVIAILEDPKYIQLQQEYLTAKMALNTAQLEFKRQADLVEGKAGSAKALELAEQEMQQQRILTKSLEQQLQLLHINTQNLSVENMSKSIKLTSPINGYVTSVNVNIGKYVSPTDVLFELVNPEDIHLNLTVFEKDLSAIQIGQKVKAFSNAQPDKIYPAEVILVGKTLSDDHAAEVHCHFESYDKTLLPGTYMNALAEIDSKPAHCLPNEAIVYFDGKSYVFVQSDEYTYNMEYVNPGISANGYTEILNYTAFGDKLIVKKNAHTLLMALKNTSEE